MINLLPPKEKEVLLLEKKKKIVMILGITAIIPLVCLGLILLSLKFYMIGQLPQENLALQQAKKEYETPDFLQTKNVIKKNNDILMALQSFYKDQVYVSTILKTVSEINRPSGIYFTNLSLKKDKLNKINVVISGFSKQREDLLMLQKNIQDTKIIENPLFSPESWINPVDVNFNLTFAITNPT